MCNTPLSKTTNRHNKLTVNDLEAADSLLRAVISHWAALGQCSVEGLRETFFKRSGKFGQRPDGHWFLTVERRTVDILVDRLPWTIGMVQRPWRTDEFLFVEW